jgi:signal peptidase II
MWPAYALLLLLAGAVVVLDQVLKALVTSRFAGGDYAELFGGLVRLDYTRNTGAAFGFLPNGGVLFAGIAVAVILAILLAYRKLGSAPLIVRAALGLVLGGALGNLIDRVRLGYVVDFIDLRWWPVFNLADSAIVVGVLLLLLYSLASSDR